MNVFADMLATLVLMVANNILSWCFILGVLAFLWVMGKFYEDVRPIVITVREGVIKSAIPNATTYAVAYTKLAVGMIVSGGICFKATWQPVTIAQTLQWASWDWMIHLGEPALASLMYLQGFLDRSMQRADELKEKSDAVAVVKVATAPPFPVATPPPSTTVPP